MMTKELIWKFFRNECTAEEKEVVAQYLEENPGVLILSRFAGAAAELPAALVVNPYDPEAVGAAMARAIMERLRFSRDEIEAAVEAVDQHMVFKDVQRMRVARLKRFMARPGFEDEMELHRVDCQSSHAMLDNYAFLREKQEQFASEPLIPPPLVNGNDLIALGWKPGPKFKEVLDAVQTRQLEGALTTREEALAWLKTEYAN